MKISDVIATCVMWTTLSIFWCEAKPVEYSECLKENNVYFHPDFHCMDCDTCEPGYGVNYDENVQYIPGKGHMSCVGCSICKEGYFNPRINREWECQPCRNCTKLGWMERTSCTPEKDAICDVFPLLPATVVYTRTKPAVHEVRNKKHSDRTDQMASNQNPNDEHPDGYVVPQWLIILACFMCVLVGMLAVFLPVYMYKQSRRRREIDTVQNTGNRKQVPADDANSTRGSNGGIPDVYIAVDPEGDSDTEESLLSATGVSTGTTGLDQADQAFPERTLSGVERYIPEKQRCESPISTSDESTDERSPLMFKKRRRRLSLPCIARDAPREPPYNKTVTSLYKTTVTFPVYEQSCENCNFDDEQPKQSSPLEILETDGETPSMLKQRRPQLKRFLSLQTDREMEETRLSTDDNPFSTSGLSFSLLDTKEESLKTSESFGHNRDDPGDEIIQALLPTVLNPQHGLDFSEDNDTNCSFEKDLSVDDLHLTAKLTAPQSCFKYLARSLGLSDSDIEIIVADNPKDVKTQAYQTLARWREIKGHSATRQVLYEALETLQRKDVIHELQKKTTHQSPGVG